MGGRHSFIRIGEGWLYLRALLDLFSHKVVGGSMSTVQDRHLVLKAMMMACSRRPDRTPVILHSDRGSQFTSRDYLQFLKDHHISSMSAVGRCEDHAAMEDPSAGSGASVLVFPVLWPWPRPERRCSTTSSASITRA